MNTEPDTNLLLRSTKEKIHHLLTSALQPSELSIRDDSAQHKTHRHYNKNRGYYTVVIKADCFNNYSKIESHRKIYQILKDLLKKEIHALSIVIKD